MSLDGKTYPAKVTQTTRTTEATKVEQVVDTATGEILAAKPTPPPTPIADSAPRPQVEEPRFPALGGQTLDEWVEADPAVVGARKHKVVTSYLSHAWSPLPDPRRDGRDRPRSGA